MGAVAVTVRTPGADPKTYRFEETPLTVGRSPTSTLAICHEAVPRELCRIWLEDQGRRVRVEEHPGLTNPLLSNGRRVAGGAGGRRLVLGIGPIELDVRAVRGPGDHLTEGRRSPPLPLIVAGVIGGGLLAWIALGTGSASPGQSSGISDLPDSPVAPAPPTGCLVPRRCRERAGLMASRAQSLLAAPAVSPADRIRAFRLLDRSAGFLAAIGAPDAGARRQEADRVRRETEEPYRRERALLGRALERGDLVDARAVAARLAEYLVAPEHRRARRWLATVGGGVDAEGVER